MKKLLAFIDRSWLHSVLVFLVLFLLSDVLGAMVGFTAVTIESLAKSVGLGLVVGVLIYWVRKQDKGLSKKEGR